jgi:hypothetical protein
VATFGLVLVIFALARTGRGRSAPSSVPGPTPSWPPRPGPIWASAAPSAQ